VKQQTEEVQGNTATAAAAGEDRFVLKSHEHCVSSAPTY
jgi:hypothetical protein